MFPVEALRADDPSELSNQITAPGILKIFGNEICEGAHYKSVLATTHSSGKELVKEALERYQTCVLCKRVCASACHLCLLFYVGPYLSYSPASSAAIYFVLHHLYIKISQKSPQWTKCWRLLKGGHVYAVMISMFRWKLTLTRCSVCYNCSAVHTLCVCQIVYLVVLKRSRTNHRFVWETACVGPGLLRPHSGEWMSVSHCLRFSQKHNGMIKTSGGHRLISLI